MTFDLPTVLAIGLPVLGFAVRLERRLVKLEQQLAAARADQGRRIGDVEGKVDHLRGQFDGFERGRRSRTAAHGHPVGGKDGE